MLLKDINPAELVADPSKRPGHVYHPETDTVFFVGPQQAAELLSASEGEAAPTDAALPAGATLPEEISQGSADFEFYVEQRFLQTKLRLEKHEADIDALRDALDSIRDGGPAILPEGETQIAKIGVDVAKEGADHTAVVLASSSGTPEATSPTQPLVLAETEHHDDIMAQIARMVGEGAPDAAPQAETPSAETVSTDAAPNNTGGKKAGK